MEEIGLQAVFLTDEFQSGFTGYIRSLTQGERQTEQFARSSDRSFSLVAASVAGLSATISSKLLDALGSMVAYFRDIATSGVNSAADLESQMSAIESVTYATEEQMAELRDTAIEIGLDPRLQASVFDVADAMDTLVRAGATTDQVINGLTTQTIAFANATGGSMVQAADIMTSAQIQWNLATEDYTRIANGATAVINASKFAIDDYRYALSRAGGAAANLGMSIEDFNLLLAAVAPYFNSGQRAGQQFSTVLSFLVPNSKRQTAAFREMGLITFDLAKGMNFLRQNGIEPAGNSIEAIVPQLFELAKGMGVITKEGAQGNAQFQKWASTQQILSNAFFDTNGNLRTGIELIEVFQKAQAGLSPMRRADLLTDAFGREGDDFVIALSRLDPSRLQELMNEFARTSAIDSAATRMDNFRGSTEILGEAIEATGIAIGLQLLPSLSDLALIFAEIVSSHGQKLIDFFGVVAVSLQGFVDSIKAGEPVFASFVAGIGSFFEALGYAHSSALALEGAINRIAAIITSVGATAFDFLRDNADALSGALGGVVAALAGFSIISTIASTIAFLASPIGLIISAAAVLGAAWNTNFLGMRDAVMWFIETIEPAVIAVASLAVQIGQIISSLAQDFAAGWNGIESTTATGATAVGQILYELGSAAATWGTDLVNVIAEGIISAVGAVVEAISYLGAIMTYWLQPNSPPRFLPALDQWGRDTAGVYLEGWTEADFSALTDFGRSIGQILAGFVGTGDLDQEGANNLLIGLREQMAQAIAELNETGQVSEETYARIRAAGGPAADEVEAFARRYIELNAAIEAAAVANERLTAATKEQEDAQEAIDDIKDRLANGDTTVTMDEIKAARERLLNAEKSVDAAEEANDAAQDGLGKAKAELDLYKARVGVETDQRDLMREMNDLAGERAKKEKEGLTALELQIKTLQMMMAHYKDRHRLAELDAILADKDATAEEKKSAQLEKQLILAEMTQRELEAAELGIDLSEVYQWPIVLEETSKKAKALKDTMGGLVGDMAAFGLPEGTLPDLDAANTKLEEIFDKLNSSEGGDSQFGIWEKMQQGGTQMPEIPWVTQMNELLDRLEQPIVLPTFSFPQGGAPEGIANLGQVFTDLQKNLSAVITFLAPALTIITDAGQKAFIIIEKSFTVLSAALSEAWTEMQPFLSAVGNVLGVVLLAAAGLIASVFAGIITGAGQLISGIIQVFTNLVNVFDGFFTWFNGGILVLEGLFQLDFTKFTDGLTQMRDGGQQILDSLLANVQTVFDTLWDIITTTAFTIVTNVIGWFQHLYDTLVGHSIIPDMVNAIIEWFTTLDTRLLEYVTNIYNNLILWFQTAFADLIIEVEGFYNDSMEWFVTFQTDLEALITTMWENIWTAFETAKTNLLNTVSTLIQSIIDKFDLANWAKLGKDLVEKIATAIKDNVGKIGQAARDLVSTLISSALAAIGNAVGGGGAATPKDVGETIPKNASGTPYWKGGLTWVGEQGAELVSIMQRQFLAGVNGPMLLNLPRGTQIMSNAMTDARLRHNDSGSRVMANNSVTSNSYRSVYNQQEQNRYYTINTQSAPMEVDRALRVSALLDS